jgi:hypothetical protein
MPNSDAKRLMTDFAHWIAFSDKKRGAEKKKRLHVNDLLWGLGKFIKL